MKHPSRYSMNRVANLQCLFVALLIGLLPCLGQAEYDPILDSIPDMVIHTIPTFEESGHAVHPDVVYFRDGMNSSYFYMAMTPLHYSDADENPSIIVSDDGYTWSETDASPMVDEPACDHNDDPDLFWNADSSKFYVHYLETLRNCGPTQNLNVIAVDSDIENWTVDTAVAYDLGYPACDEFILSPAMVQNHDTFYMFYAINTKYTSQCSQPTKEIRYMTSSDGFGFSKDSSYAISTTNWPTGIVPWHLDVFDGRDGWFYMLLTDTSPQHDLWIARSDDLQNWDFVQSAVLEGGETYSFDGQDHYVQYMYRSTGVVNSSMDLMVLWFSFHESAGWGIGTAKFELSDLFPVSTLNVPSSYATIQAAINAASDGDTILVAPGTYTESPDYGGKSLVVKSSDGPLVTTITGADTVNLVVFDDEETRAAVLEGFTLEGGKMAIWCQSSSPTIRGNLIKDQNITNWAAVVFSGEGWGTVGPSPALFTNNTVTNSANGAISTFSSVTPTMTNNVITDCSYGIHQQGSGGSVVPDLAYNNVWDCTNHYYNCPDTGDGTISSDPLFTSSYSLFRSSPCIDAGDPSAYYVDPDGTRNDMGARPTYQVGSSTDYTTIQSAINAVEDGDVVLVQTDTYTESISWASKDIYVLAKDLYDSTTITNNSSTDLIVFSGGVTSAALLDGFILDGGRIAIWCKSSAPTISHCLMKDQNITNWAAVALSGNSWGSTGASPAVLINNTIVNSGNGGLSTFSTSAPTIMNTIIAGCSYGIHHQNSGGSVAPTLSYNDVWNCTVHYYNCSDTGTGTISSNPLLTGSHHELSFGSPCINTGNPGSQYDDPDSSRNDMGWQPYVLRVLKRITKPNSHNELAALPAAYSLMQNYPNPFNPETEIRFTLAIASQVRLEVFNIIGQQVAVLADERLGAGEHSVAWNGDRVASGIYLYRLTTDDFVETKKMMLLK